MEPLFYANLFPNILLTKKIYDCTSIQVIFERNLPMFVCKLCANKLDEYVRFRERCIANDEFLRNALAAFDMGNVSNNRGPAVVGANQTIKTEPEDMPLPKLSQCLGVMPLELNCALVAAATAGGGHQKGKVEPPDDDDADDDEEEEEEQAMHSVRVYGHQPQIGSPERGTGCGRAQDCTINRLHDGQCRDDRDEDISRRAADDDDDDDDVDEPYVCLICSKSFKIRHHLVVHSHTHVDNQSPTAGGLLNGAKQAYNCPKCSKVFVNKGNLLNHLETHTNEKSYACEICSKSFKYNVQLRLHMRIHTGERPHKCEICNRGFSQLSNLRSHRKTHSKVKPYKCHLCLKSFTMLDNLTAHSAKCLKDKYRCTLCSKSFAKEGNLLSHLQSHSEGVVEKMFKCEMCPKSFKNKEDWKRHVRVHTGEKPYTCDICAKGFAQKANLLSHRKTHLKPNVVFKCDRCDRTFRSQKVLEMHLPKCGGGRRGDGPIPSAPVTPSGSLPGSPSPGMVVTPSAATTPTLSEALSDLLRYEIALRAPLELQQMLLGHMERKKAHAGGGKADVRSRRYRCDVCFKGYSQYPSLIKHRKLHFKVPPLVKVLGRTKHPTVVHAHGDGGEGGGGAHNGAIDGGGESGDADGGDGGIHEDNGSGKGGIAGTPEPHDPERPFSCDICGKNFKFNRNLKVHAKLHIRSNRFKCDKCTNTFAQAEDLKHHLRTHPIAAEKIFSCEYCSNMFKSNEDLKRHRRSHTGERPFRCERCPKAFTQLSNLRTHARIHERCTTCREEEQGCRFPAPALNPMQGQPDSYRCDQHQLSVRAVTS